MSISSIALTFALMVLPASGRSSPSAMSDDFQGEWQGVQTPVSFDCPFRSVQSVGTGRAVGVGRFTLDIPHIVNVSTSMSIGSYRFTTADGEMLCADFSGHLAPTRIQNVVSYVETATITGGTDRFAGATGSFIVKRHINTISGTTSGSFEGIILTTGPFQSGVVPCCP